ncbi:hypothetical protein VZ228_03325, partial [Metamycoplasma hominis]
KLNMFGIDSQNIQEYCDNLDAKFGVENSLDNLFIYNQVIIKDKYLQINDNYVKINCLNKLPFELSDKWIKTLFSINGTCIWNNFPWNNNFANKKMDKSMMASIDTTNATGSVSANLVGSIDEQATM